MQNRKSNFVQIERRGRISETEFQELFLALNQRKTQAVLNAQLPIEKLPIKVGENIVAPKRAEIPDCLTCGACCVFLLCVAVNQTDQTPADAFWEITNETRTGEITVDRFMRRDAETTACQSLDGKLGELATCRIYHDRPKVCREFEAGSDKCRALRRAYKIEPELTDAQKLEAEFRLELAAVHQTPSLKIVYARIVPHPETQEFVIIALLEDETNLVLHIFDPAQESWLQSEFANRSLTEASEMIAARRAQTAIQQPLE